MNRDISQLETKTSYIYKSIKSDILKGKVTPGQKLVIAQLARSFGVSAIPVREAINQLKAEGFLDNVPHTGIYVKEIDIDYLKEVYPIRGVLEAYATRLAVPALNNTDFGKLNKIAGKLKAQIDKGNYSNISNLNYDFHMLVYRKANNKALLKMIDDLIKSTNPVRVMFDLMPQRAESSSHEHQEILDALTQRDADLAADLTNAHIQETLQVLIRFIQKEKRI